MEEIGVRAWFNDFSMAPKRRAEIAAKLSTHRLLESWVAIELDFQSQGMDLYELKDKRPYRWFKLRMIGFLADPRSHLFQALNVKGRDNARTNSS